MSSYHLTLLQKNHARQILGWRYPSPYDFYNPPENRPPEEYVAEFVNPEYQFHAILDGNNEFVGFCSFGMDGQVPGGNYTEEALDIGVGMKPELTGMGLGRQFFDAVLQFAMARFNPAWTRLTVAKFNKRALNLYKNFGFTLVDEFDDERLNVRYTILIRQSPKADQGPGD
jgi:[ribosomal protein S18]-alanine N-acetyltransferase